MTKSDGDRDAANGNVFALFEGAALANTERPCLVVGDATLLTYSALLAETARAAAWLRSLGLQSGDRALVQVHKSPAAVVFYLACLRAGVVFIPLNTAYQESEVAYFLSDAEPALLVASPGLAGQAAAFGGTRVLIEGSLESVPWAATRETLPAADLCGSDPAAILYTSGTTGRSKGAVLTHGNLSSNVKILVEGWQWRDDDVLLHALPIFHAHGLFVALHCALLRASPILFHERFDVRATLRDLPRATVFMGVPTFYTRLLSEPAFDQPLCAHVRVFISGSAPLLDATFEEFRLRTGHTILERYGMTEALMVTSNPFDGPRVAGSVGPALAGVSVRVVAEGGGPAATGEPGMLEISGPSLFAGYWRNPEKTEQDHTKDGFFITGDIATEDADGFIRIVGRAKDLVISGGFNVYPKEIEMAIDALDGVLESAVIGVPHPDFGEAVLAVVARVPGADLEPEIITGALVTVLAAFKRPKKIIIVNELPLNPMGISQKAELRRVFVESLAAAPA